MPPPRRNLGPAAAAGNRAALLASAHAVFAESGAQAPLSSIARRAGVGQGSLYRHFPDRLTLVAAVVEENVERLEEASIDQGATLVGLLGLVTRHAIESVGVVDLLAEDRPGRMLELRDRVAAVLDAHLADGLAADDVPAGTTVADLMLGIEMVSGALTRRPVPERAELATRAWALVGVRVRDVQDEDRSAAGR
ncbi:TetR/AcrR family transcriptional regulator [Isoptericola sp. NEAU-Y5]|uniref:TetR/AcrR family transcriptional regulator n=1 Tax=Isoptericola luteus TaxID=2879484 RepID=A0ABS7ZBX9_9MICO|nr:helix-turn-helix domain-containing protein [Isoptericola sp. NEAU-Y5]MCA5892556.1 TetR/AcrR family transcriptional regulator [Isoptericola sp. NEAU-Y5]